MKRFLLLLCLILLSIVVVESLYLVQSPQAPPPTTPAPPTPIPTATPVPKPLLAYSFENLRNTQFPINPITLGPVVSENKYSVARKFYYTVPEAPDSTVMEQVSGLMNVPKKSGQYPVIVMFRGYISSETFKPGAGTQPSAQVLAQNGFITLAPDFLGFGESDPAAADPFEARFQTYTSALTLLASLPTLNDSMNQVYTGTVTADLTKIGLWGHSNGGHIALSVLAISGLTYPTVLWAPVSVSFPYSILFYTDDTDDHGMAMRRALARFEANYDTELFSPPNYFSWIKAPIQLHQGSADQVVLGGWSDALARTLKKNGLPVEYYTYTGADHNLQPSSWSLAVQRTMEFYNHR